MSAVVGPGGKAGAGEQDHRICVRQPWVCCVGVQRGYHVFVFHPRCRGGEGGWLSPCTGLPLG
jgi:hypothetical protein